MASGEHNHRWNTVLQVKTGTQHTGQESLEVYKQCECGAVTKSHYLVTHIDGVKQTY